MNYRHIYHAGNFADVFKHIVLMLTLDYLKQKDKPFFALDTHAGIGRYDLSSEQAQKTNEAADGIGMLWDLPDLPEGINRYLELVRRLNRSRDLRVYPGSPLIMKEMLRTEDRMVVNELHPEDVRTLRQAMGGDARARVESMDAYQALKAFLPPPERRGMVLIDPPFEVTNEFELMAEGLRQAHRRWATGIYLFWYPIKDDRGVKKFHASVKTSGIADCKALDFYLRKENIPETLNGCGVLTVNAPWTLSESMKALMPTLIEHLTDGEGWFQVTEITGE